MGNISSRPTGPSRYVALLAVSLGWLLVSDLAGQRREPGEWRTELVDGREAVEGEVLVRFRTRPGGFEEARAAADVETEQSETIGNGLRRWRAKRLRTRELIARLRANPDVEFVEPNYVIRVAAVPNDPSFGNLWGLFNSGQTVFGSPGIAGADIDAPQAWDLSTGSRDHVVGVIDSGIDYNHPDLAANIWSAPTAFQVVVGGLVITCPAGSHGFNAILNTCNPMDDHAHGTHVAGTIGAVGNNGIGITGVNWTASMMGLKFLSAFGSGSTSDAIKAIDFAIQTKNYFAATAAANVRVLSNSWGGGGFSIFLLDAINRANAANMLFVAAAGNDAVNNDIIPHYPSSYTASNVLAVASTTNREERSWFSNYGVVSVDMGAPGSAIQSTTPNNNYEYFQGTSMATPHVSGAAQLLLSHCDLPTTAALKSALMVNVTPVPAMSGFTVTGGRLNVNNAIRVCPPKPNPVPAITALTPPIAYVGRALTLTVDGARFVSASQVRIDGAPLPTTYVSPTRLTAAIQASDLPFVGTRVIRVFSPAPGGGTSVGVNLFVHPPPTITVNGSAGAISVAPGAAMTIAVAGGPAHVYDWVTIAPVGSSDTTYSGTWFLNGTSTPPFVGVSGASFPVPAPSTSGLYEVRFLASGRYQRLATSGVVTVGPQNPVPQVASLQPTGLAAGTGSASMIVHGSDFVASSVVRFDGVARPTTFFGSTMLGILLQAADLASIGTYTVTVHTPGPGGGTSSGRTFTVTAPPPVPVLTSISPASVAVNSAFTLTVTGTGFAPNSAIEVDGVWKSTGHPSSTSLTTLIAASDVASIGTRSIRVFTPAPGGGTSAALPLTIVGPTMTVNGSSGALSVAPGAALAVAITNGPAHVYDWVTIVPVGSAATAYSGIWFLSGTSAPPASGQSTAAFTIPAPATAGDYEVRFLASGKYQRLATSGVITVGAASPPPTPPPPPPPPPSGMLTVNGSSGAFSVSPGATLTIAITNGPGHVYDWITIVPAGSADTTYTGIWFLSGTSTPPASGLANATFTIAAPATAGDYEVRFLASGKYQRLATSGIITVGGGSPPPPPPPPPPSGMLTVNGSAGGFSVSPGAALTITITNGPGHVYDWVTIVPVGAVDTAYSGIWFLSGTATPPASGKTNATFVIPAPATAGTYEVRFLASGRYQRLATSGVITVVP